MSEWTDKENKSVCTQKKKNVSEIRRCAEVGSTNLMSYADKIIAIYVLDQFLSQSQDKRTCFMISNMSYNDIKNSNLNYAVFTHEQR